MKDDKKTEKLLSCVIKCQSEIVQQNYKQAKMLLEEIRILLEEDSKKQSNEVSYK